MKMEMKKKRKKIRAYRKSVQKETRVKRCHLILDLKVLKIIGQRKTFYRKRIPESSCARKEIVDIDILVTSGNGEKSCNLSEQRVDLPREKGSGIS